MLSLYDLHAQIDEDLNINSVESSFSSEYYTDLINAQREVSLRNEYNKNRTIDPYIIQDLNCLELELASPIQCCVEVPLGCKLLRTVSEIPNTIEFYYSKGIVSIGSPDITKERITLIDYSRVPYIGYGRTTSKTIYAFLYMKRIYLISKSSSYLLMKKLNIRGIFTDPTLLGQFNNCEDSPCWTLDSPYPLNQWMWITLVKPYIMQILMQKMQFPTDDANDTKDSNTEIRSNGRR